MADQNLCKNPGQDVFGAPAAASNLPHDEDLRLKSCESGGLWNYVLLTLSKPEPSPHANNEDVKLKYFE